MFKYNELKIIFSKVKALVACIVITMLLFNFGFVIPVGEINIYIFLIGLILLLALIPLRIFTPWWSYKRALLTKCIGAIEIALSIVCLPIAAKLIIHAVDGNNPASFILGLPFFAAPLMASAYKRISEI